MFPAVLALANRISELLGRGLYPTDEAARLAKQFPDAQAGTETEIANLRAQMQQLEDELARLKGPGELRRPQLRRTSRRLRPRAEGRRLPPLRPPLRLPRRKARRPRRRNPGDPEAHDDGDPPATPPPHPPRQRRGR